MVNTPTITVEIRNKCQCVYKYSMKNEENDLYNLIAQLSCIQQKINDVLTEIVQTELGGNENEMIADDIEFSEENGDSEEEDKPTKAKKPNMKHVYSSVKSSTI